MKSFIAILVFISVALSLADLETLTKTVEVLQDEIERLNGKIEKLQAPVAAFSAYRASTGSVASGATIIWDAERFDVASNYNPANGIFTCPTDGYYYFSVTVYSGPDVYNSAALIVNNQPQGGAFGDGAHADQGAKSYIVYCNANESVFVRNAGDAGANFGAAYGGMISNGFIGFYVSSA